MADNNIVSRMSRKRQLRKSRPFEIRKQQKNADKLHVRNTL